MSTPASQAYCRMLIRWLPSAREHFTAMSDQPGCGFYGSGHGGWGMMAQAAFVGAAGYLAGMKDWPGDARVSRDETVAMLQSAFRFLFRTHITGDMPANNGRQWGFGASPYDLWHAPAYFEQALSTLAHYRNLLGDDDVRRMERALAHEADSRERIGLSAEAGSLPTRDPQRTNSETNSWTAALLSRAAIYLPGHPRASAWLQGASRFWTNALSAPQDEWDPTVIDGRPLAGWFTGANLGPHYTLEHHGFFHPGYLIWSLLPMCTALVEFRRAGRPPIQAASHHFRECFDVVKRLTLWNGRLAFPAGSDGPQYIYGQSFLVALCEFAAANGDPDAARIADELRANIEAEQLGNRDGSFFGRRLGAMLKLFPISYYRYDADQALVSAVSASFCDSLPSRSDPCSEADFIRRTSGTLAEPAIGLAFCKSEKRFASVSYNAHVSKFQSLVVPAGGGHLLRHSCNGYGRLILADSQSATVVSHQDLATTRRPEPLWRQMWALGDGFVAAGQLSRQSFINTNVPAADQYLAVFALPDGATVVQIDIVQMRGLARVLESGSGGWMLATDIFTAPGTMLRWATGQADLGKPVDSDQAVMIESNWANLADKLAICGLWGGGSFWFNRLGRRRDGQLWTRPRPDLLLAEESLTADELFYAYENYRGEPGGGHLVRRGSLIRDAAFAQIVGLDADQTAKIHRDLLGAQIRQRDGLVRGAMIAGRDGKDYLLAVNFDPHENTLPLAARSATEWRSVTDTMPARFERQRIVLPPRSCLLAARTNTA